MATIWKPSEQGELYHYGVIGMKWGVHKTNKYRRSYQVQSELARQRMEESNRGTKFENNISKTPVTTVSKAEAKKYSKKNVGQLIEGSDEARRRYSEASHKLDKKATSKLEKFNKRYQKKQARADRAFVRAERKANSFFSSERSAKRAYRRASKKQFRANKVAYKGKEWFRKMEKAYKDADINMSPETKNLGREFVKRVERQSKAMYNAQWVRG